MGFKCGIVGLPNVGKSTLFNCLTKAKVEAANYPFCTIEPNVGVIPVPDPRLDKLTEFVKPKQTVPTVVQIVDIAGLVKGASRGEGLGNQFLANIRECEAILHVLRCFADPNIVHVEGSVDPVRDKEIIDTELQFKDMELLERKLERTQKMTKGGNKEAVRQVAIIEKYLSHIKQGKNLRSLEVTEEERVFMENTGLLTDKKVMYICNVDEGSLPDGDNNPFVQQVKAIAKEEEAGIIVISAAFEEQLMSFEDPADVQDFMDSVGIVEPGLNRLIREAYYLLDLYTYFTAGEKEVRAWTITRGTKAPQAAGVIHSDFEKGFIRAEVIGYLDFVEYKSEAAIKEAGRMRVEGKEYVVADGDVMHFRFNV
ncbi:MAG: redox-regulated ATPase YchF [Bacteroidetes bacterium]|nr:MAG: redox-regulated ATPase YchF [Bacteroidota bacterium]